MRLLALSLRAGNLALLGLCCFLAAQIATDISAEWLRPGAPPPPPPVDDVATWSPTAWEEREPILARNLFDAGLEEVVEAPPPEEEIEKTELRLELMATLSSSNRSTRMASIWNQVERDYQVLRPGDALEHYEDVQLARVERRRVILRNGDALEELHLDDRERRFDKSAAAARKSRAVRERLLEMRSRSRSVRNRR